MGRMLLKLRPDVAVTASGRSCYVRRDVATATS